MSTIESIDKGQYIAAKSFDMNDGMTARVKESSLVPVIATTDLTKVEHEIVANSFHRLKHD